MEAINNKHIVLISVDEDDGYILSEVIAKLADKVRFTHLYNCKNVFETLKKDTAIDIIILELSTPFAMGLDCLKQIRNDLEFDNVPVAIYSGLNSKMIVEESFEAGANYFLVKPNNYSETFRLFKKLFKEGLMHVKELKAQSNFIVEV
jgi:PleD family two-component response regulator